MKIDFKHLAGLALLCFGVLAWGANGSALRSQGALEAKPNILTLKGSPFGRTLAVAMRGPVDVYWHKGEVHHEIIRSDASHDCAGCADGREGCHEHSVASLDTVRDALQGNRRASDAPWNLRTFALDQIEDWRKAYYTRTNPFGSTKLHQAYIMGETEKRLRLSYEMDPTNFSTYGSYFLFLSEALAAVRDENGSIDVQHRAERAALELSERTVMACLRHQDEPGALLTAAAAAHDHAHLLFARRDSAAADQRARHYVAIQDACLRDFRGLKARMQSEGFWERIPGQRLLEMETQQHLLEKYLQANLAFLGSREFRQTSNPTHSTKAS